ncbi:hypothetical protein AA0X95_16615 [Bacillus sp. 1P10SD]|uniref:hypothetical protein n=1 Tax=Bacillus sp. 1P10SD TaxID=3132265 RepID=UPI0039A4491C
MTVRHQVESFIEEYNNKLSDLYGRLQDTTERIEYLQLEVKMLQEVEIPEASASAVLNGTDESHVNKLKKQHQKYNDELEMKKEVLLVINHAIKQHQIKAGEKLVELDRLYRQEKSIQEKKHYSKMMYYKKQFIDSMIEEGEKLKELTSLDYKIQEILVQAGRKNGVFVDSNVKSTATNTNDGRTYLPLSLTECQRFVSGNYTESDYKYLKPFNSLKDLG